MESSEFNQKYLQVNHFKFQFANKLFFLFSDLLPQIQTHHIRSFTQYHRTARRGQELGHQQLSVLLPQLEQQAIVGYVY